MVFDRAGSVVASAQQEHTQIYPQPGWVEHDPEEIRQSTVGVIREVADKASLKPGDLAAIGITNQRETTVLWNKHTGRPAANAIVWQDTRVAGEVARLSREMGQDAFRRQTGLPLTTY
jgi:glycerol kinase